MDSPGNATSSLMKLILCVCLLNLVGTGYLISSTRSSVSAPPVQAGTSLPPGLDSATERAALFERFKPLYNTKDYEGLYSFFDPAVRVQLPREKMVATLDDLYRFTGQIKSGAYASYEVETGQGGSKNYTLLYPMDTEKGDAILLITVFQQGEEPYRLTGFRIKKE